MIPVAAVAGCALAAGLLTGRSAVLVPAAVAWPVYFVGLGRGWWGSGLGDGWPWALTAACAVTCAAAGLGVAMGRRLMR